MLATSMPLAWGLERATLPTAFLLGPMIAAIGFGIGGTKLQSPPWAFTCAQAIIGCLVASDMNASILATVSRDWATILVVISTTIAAGATAGWTLARLKVLPAATAAWGSSPGGSSAMVAMAEEHGADARLVAFMQYLRLTIVVLSASVVSRFLPHIGPATAATILAPKAATLMAPKAAQVASGSFRTLLKTFAVAGFGGVAGRRLRIPAGPLLVSMLVGVLLQVNGLIRMDLPPWLLGVAYTAVGWHIGLDFTREVVVHAWRALPRVLVATFMLIGLCAGSAWVLTWLLHVDPLTAYLATSPGGLGSMAILAASSPVNISFVLAVQTMRVFAVVLTGPPIARLIIRLS